MRLIAGTNGTQIVASWQAISGVDGYNAALNTNGSWGAAQSVSAPTVTFPDELTAGSQYQVRVSAYKGISTGPWSPAIPGLFLRAATAQYDGFGRLTTIDFATWSTTYTYDALGNITTVTTHVTQ